MAQYSFKKDDLGSANKMHPLDEAKRSLYKGEPVSEKVKEELFKEWLLKRMEKYGYTPNDCPDYMGKAYRSGNPKDLNFSVCQEWNEHIKPQPPLPTSTVGAGGVSYKVGPRGGRYYEDVDQYGRPTRRYF